MDTTTGGISVTVAVAFFVGSATLVAVTVATVCAGIDAGAVYRPDGDTVPTEAVHVTPAFAVPVTPVGPVTDAVNCCV